MKSSSPIAVCCVPGVDASSRIELLAKSLSVKLISLAMGTRESVE